MTLLTKSPESSGVQATPMADAGHNHAADIAVERTRILYQGSRVPSVFMLLSSLVCTGLLCDVAHPGLLWSWALWVAVLAAVRLLQVRAFNRALPSEQAERRWHRNFLAGAGVCGLTLGFAAVLIAPANDLMLQALAYALIASAVLSASVAYAISYGAFLAFVLPCMVPLLVSLLSAAEQRSWGVLLGILLFALLVVAWQVNRMLRGSLRQRFQNQVLISNLEYAKLQAESLNANLAHEVGQRRRAERNVRQAHEQLEERVEERTRELDQTTRALSKSRARLSMAIEASGLGLWDWNLQSDEVHHSQIEQVFGLQGHALQSMLRDLTPRLHPDDLPQLREALIEHMRGATDGYHLEYRVRHADGHWIWIEDRAKAVERDDNGRVLRMLGTHRDISARKQQEQQQQLAATVFEAASEGIVILDPRYHFISVNRAFSLLTGYSRDEVLGKSVMALIGSSDNRRQYHSIRSELDLTGRWQGELLETRRNGEIYPQWLQLNVVHDSAGVVSHIVGFFTDLSARREAEERLRYLSDYDELTGLANRSLFKQRLQAAGQRSRQLGQGLALLHIDLDRFKILNDSLGHEVADQLLREVGRRLGQALPEADTLARLSGDEFVAIIDSYSSLPSLTRLAGRLLSMLRMPLTVAGQELVISASLGISLMPDNAREIPLLLSQANMAMQHAKHLGGNTLQFYTDNLQAGTLERLQLETQLRKGIAEGQLEVFYQPKLCLASGGIYSAEALVRWRHPERGLIAPGEFIGLAEETGLIGSIGEIVLQAACTQARIWQTQGPGPVRVSVNLSVHQLRQGNLYSLVCQTLEQTGLPAHLLELELTESQLLENVESVISTFRQLRALGVKLAIDDFGTGYSSLSYLKRFPVDYVKIDQSFIRHLTLGSEDAAITRAIIAMAHSLELKVVAEGVETQEQLEFLRSQSCDEVQGYLISKPVSAGHFAELLGEQMRMCGGLR